MNHDAWHGGFVAAFEIAVQERGDLLRILGRLNALVETETDPGRLAGEFSARARIVDTLLPDDVQLGEWLATHIPDDADAEAVADLAGRYALNVGSSACGTNRTGLFGKAQLA